MLGRFSFFLLEFVERNAYSASQEGVRDLSNEIILCFRKEKNKFCVLDDRLNLLSNFNMGK